MKKIALMLSVAAIALTGCSHSYVMKMSNGNKIVTPSKPKLENGSYVYKDANGQKHYVTQARVVEIAPASFGNDDKSNFNARK